MRARLPRLAVEHSAPLKAAGDATSWAVGILIAAVVRYDVGLHGLAGHALRVVLLMVTAIGFQLLFGLAFGLYRNHWRFASFEEVAVVARSAIATLLALLLSDVTLRRGGLPLALSVGATIVALCIMVGLRYTWRLLEQVRLRPAAGGRPMLVFGAGEGAEQLLHSLLRNPDSSYLPIAIIDDDPAKANLRIKGIRVVGDRTRIAAAAAAHGADLLVIAVPSAESVLVRGVTDIAREAGLEVRLLPPTNELLDGRISAGDLRTPTMADLLGRRQVQTDLESAATYLRGRRVLVTGAGGSIGSELCRQVARLDPGELMMLDRDESALHAVQLSLDGRGMLDSTDLVLLDIRDAESVSALFHARRPDVVFHAAALKHLTLLESHPAESVKSNVWGTQNLLSSAVATGVECFVNISTDKAANPISALGCSKRIAERFTAHAARTALAGRYLSVRFGNVLGSRGSVLPAFKAQLESGGPLLVTHPDVSRYFMTTEEAVQLVIQAGGIGPAGAVMVLDMGKPVRIAEVAARMISDAGKDVSIVFTGLRPGEKLHEELFGATEVPRPSTHPLIRQVDSPPLDPAVAARLFAAAGPTGVRAGLEACEQAATDEAEVEMIDIRERSAAAPESRPAGASPAVELPSGRLRLSSPAQTRLP